ncbi:unnamed protein product [Dibothriocephalus latus]|uniref:C2H2-type domain-containing protein n=1 Tax=Dibothriocephalus latus TaxID=60516 RepID=A0A3P6TG46_DIBLA|nr:unnamed protein product [Dibothriocephalus latus]
MVRHLGGEMTASITDRRTASKAFAVTNGLKQGCFFAPMPLNLMFSAMLMDLYRDERPGNRKEPAQDRRAWRGTVKTGAVIYESSQIDATNAKRTARNYQTQRTPAVITQALPIYPRCQRTLRACIGFVGHLRTQCIIRPTASMTSTFPQTGDPVPGALTHSKDRRLDCPDCPREFPHCMDLLGHICIHDSGNHRDFDTTSTSCTSITSFNPTHSTSVTTTNTGSATHTPTGMYCPNCNWKLTSRICPVGHL